MPEELFLEEINAIYTRENLRDAREMLVYSLEIIENEDIDSYEYDD